MKSTSVELGAFSFAAGVYEAGPHVEHDQRIQWFSLTILWMNTRNFRYPEVDETNKNE